MNNNYNRQLAEEGRTGTAAGNDGVEAEAATSKNGTIAVLPTLDADAMGAILDHLPLADVKSSLLAGRITTSNAVKHVTTVNLFRVEELNASVGTRFSNATNVNIFSLLTFHPDIDFELRAAPSAAVSRQAVQTIPTVLTSFRKLKHAFIGGYSTGCLGPFNGDGLELSERYFLYHTLLDDLCGLYRAGALSQEVILDSILSNYNLHTKCDGMAYNDDERSCILCRTVCETFPLCPIIAHMPPFEWDYGGCCLSSNQFWDIVSSRKSISTEETKESTLKAALEKFKSTLELYGQSRHPRYYKNGTDKLQAIQALKAKYNAQGDGLYYYDECHLLYFEDAVKYGVDASSLTREYVLQTAFRAAFYSIGGGVPGSVMILRSSVEHLTSVGVNIVRNDGIVRDDGIVRGDFILVDDDEPLLETLLAAERDAGFVLNPL